MKWQVHYYWIALLKLSVYSNWILMYQIKKNQIASSVFSYKHMSYLDTGLFQFNQKKRNYDFQCFPRVESFAHFVLKSWVASDFLMI
jgi:hypothetical protein